jgi:beta-1,4-N-acetylglucosaminyltransferase
MKLMLVCTSGGHFSTMKSLEKFWKQHDRVWVTDYKHDTASLANSEKAYWLSFQAPRDLLAFAKNLPETFRIIEREKPDLVVSTGASIAVNFAIAAKLSGCKYMFIESLSRPRRLSMSGKLVYLLCDELYVQWPDISKRYKKAIYAGCV